MVWMAQKYPRTQMIVTKKAMPRRTILRGLGAAVALPLLDSMVPAFAGVRHAVAQPTLRLGVVYVPHGVVMAKWLPSPVYTSSTGGGWSATPILEPIVPYREDLLVLEGLSNTAAASPPGEFAGWHSRVSGAFLTGVTVQEGPARAGISMDQVAAAHMRQDTRLPSLELRLRSSERPGVCEDGFDCAYVNTLCWQTPTTPLHMEDKPQAVFSRLFGDMKQDGSLLDVLSQEFDQINRKIGADDRVKVADYLDAVRGVERRIQQASSTGGIPASFEEYAKVMFDLQVLAYQGDVTRVITFVMGEELGDRSYPEIEVPEGHHVLSHHGDDIEKIEKLVKINRYHTGVFAYYLEKLRSTPDGDGSLLDHLMIIYGSGMSDGNAHDVSNLPILLAGSGNGQISVGVHLRYPDPTPLANLHLSLLSRLGVAMESFGDSTGELRFLG